MREPIEVDGDPPGLDSVICEDLIAEEYWHRGERVDEANVVWVRVGCGWQRWFLDDGVLYWRPADVAPSAYDLPELIGEVKLADLEGSA